MPHRDAGVCDRWPRTLTFLAGAYQLAFGLARLGTVVNFVSHTWSSGSRRCRVLIATSQMKHVSASIFPKGEPFFTPGWTSARWRRISARPR